MIFNAVPGKNPDVSFRRVKILKITQKNAKGVRFLVSFSKKLAFDSTQYHTLTIPHALLDHFGTPSIGDELNVFTPDEGYYALTERKVTLYVRMDQLLPATLLQEKEAKILEAVNICA
jgi:hypothetical protein